MRCALFVALALGLCVQPAGAQTRIYVSGDLFAEITRLSRATTPDILGTTSVATPRDGVTIGGGGRIGAFFTPTWSLEFGIDVGKTVSDERTLEARAPIGFPVNLFPRLQYQSRTSHRYSASSVLLGYHPLSRGRIQPGFRGGVSFMRTERTFTVTSVGTGVILVPLPGIPTLPRIEVVTDEYTTVANGLTATLAAEAAIDLSDHLAVVPEMRAHAGGGIGGFLLRPGVAVRWRW